ncbi:retrovirus-related pol polyprotein from transposon TNT 1-94 [Tanacetum coccineum]
MFQKGDNPIDSINHMVSFLTAVVTSCYPTTNNQLRNSSNPRQQATINDGRVTLQPILGRHTSFAMGTIRTYTPGASGSNSRKQRTIICELNIAKVALMANLSHYGSDALVEVHNHDNVNNNMINQAVQVMTSSEQDEQLKTQVVNCTKINLDYKSVNDTLTAELERYKEKVKVFKEGQNVDLRSNDNISDSSAQSVEIDRLKQTLSEHLKENESLMQTNSVNSPDPTFSSRPTKVEVPKELPKVSMVNMSLKKLKHHLAGFDVFIKERSMSTAITEGSWGFEHTKACFRDEIIPFVKALKDLFNTFDQYLIDELSKTKNVFHQMEQAFLKFETELLNKKNFVEKEIYDKLFKSFTTLEKHCISLEVDTQLNQEIFQRDNSVSNQSAPSFDQLFELNELKAQSQEKDTVIKKLKERIKSLSGKMNEDKIKKDLEEIETINIELDHRVSKLIAENEHLKQTYKQLYDSIKPARIRSKEQCDDLINQVNLMSVEISDLNASLQEKVLVITTLKVDLRKLKGKYLVDNAVTKHNIDPEMLKIDVEPITPKLLNKRQPTMLILSTLRKKLPKTCPSINNTDGKLVVVTPKNKDKRVRFTEPVTSSGNINTKTSSSSNLVSNKPMLSSIGVKPSTSASRSQPSGNTKKDKIQQTPSSTQKNKVEAHPRKVNSSLKNKECIVQPKGTAYVQHSKLNENSELKCVKCNGCMLSDNHDLCVLDFINNVNAHKKSKSVKKSLKRKVWKPTGKVFTNIGYIWRPTGRTFTIVGNACPLTRITTTTEVPFRKPTTLENETPKPVVTLVYSRKPRKSQTNVPVIQIVLWYLDSGCSKYMTRDRSQLTNFVNNFWVQSNSEMITWQRYWDMVIIRLGMLRSQEFTMWSKDEAPDFIIKFLKMIQVRLKVPVRRIRIDNGTEFVNHTLREYSEKVGISHETSVARSPQQNGVIERLNRTLIEVARTMLIYAKDPLFLWAEAVATAYFDKLTAMASEHSSLRPALHEMTPATISSGLMPNLASFKTICTTFKK